MHQRTSEITPHPEYFDRYILLVDDFTLGEALLRTAGTFSAMAEELKRIGDRVYAPGKWTAREVLQHCVDTERILAYRALRFSRNDRTPLAGFDENLFGRNTTAGSRTVDSLLQEFSLVRQSTIILFESFDNNMMARTGVCDHKTLSVLALGFAIAGHAVHHSAILREKYVLNQDGYLATPHFPVGNTIPPESN
ncbi:DinB family protein [Ravibacter arvi]|uniref:DinB family protein n=1 Tax=Ravibacter arvi TaxID=2051041 RepID=A0ABP8LZ67_9BACT